MSEKIVQLNEEVIKGQLKELVRGNVGETLNELWRPRRRNRPKWPGTSVMSSGRATAAVTTAATLPPLPGTLSSRYPSSKGSPLRPPSLSGIAASEQAHHQQQRTQPSHILSSNSKSPHTFKARSRA